MNRKNRKAPPPRGMNYKIPKREKHGTVLCVCCADNICLECEKHIHDINVSVCCHKGIQKSVLK